jgi:phosphate starvation-inducible protein PhoH and related proteins
LKTTLNFRTPQLVRSLFAREEKNIIFFGETLGVRVVARDNFIRLSGPDEAVERAGELLGQLVGIVETGKPLGSAECRRIIKTYCSDNCYPVGEIYGDRIEVASRQGFVRPQTANQKKYIDALRKYELVFSIGPAGTGKTYLAMAIGVSYLMEGKVKRLVLTRPAREAGEKLGFLPGDIYEKIIPYLRPIYDALYDLMEAERVRKYEEDGIIEVAPLAFMRGRTLNNAFIILDEAQNTTPEQMKMFLTRIGFHSRVAVTGDITQMDLPRNQVSGLNSARGVLQDIPEIPFVYLTREDVVRHPLVQKIVDAYEQAGE